MKYLYEQKLIEKEKNNTIDMTNIVSGRRLSSIRHLARSINDAGNTYFCFKLFYVILFIYLTSQVLLLFHKTFKDQMIMKQY